jgi:hypothetical protein
MCGPAAASAALSMAGSVMEYNEANENYVAAVDANNRSRVSAIRSRDLQISQTQLRNEQEQNKLADEKFDNLIKGIENAESFKTAAGEDNIIGRSIHMALSDRVADRLRNASKISTQASYVNQQANVDALGIQAQLEGRLASVVDPAKPNLGSYMIKGASSAFGNYASIGGGTSWSDLGKATMGTA